MSVIDVMLTHYFQTVLVILYNIVLDLQKLEVGYIDLGDDHISVLCIAFYIDEDLFQMDTSCTFFLWMDLCH